MVEPGRGPPLLVEPLDDLGVARLLGREQLQGDVAVEPRVERAEDGPHAADADRLLQLEAVDPLPDLGECAAAVPPAMARRAEEPVRTVGESP